MKVLEAFPERKYSMLIYEDEDIDVFRERLVKSGGFTGEPVRLTDGRVVGRVLSAATFPQPFTTPDGDSYPHGTAVLEIQWASAEFMKVAHEAEIEIEPSGRVLLVGDGAGDRRVEKSQSALLSAEIRERWGFV
jgi:hypothetical protein